MTRYTIIRDDDINFFSNPNHLEKIYGELSSQKIPLNLSIIPAIKPNYNIEKNIYSEQNKLNYEPFIPREYRNNNRCFPVYNNDDLVDFIRNISNVEILQHGLYHTPNEFMVSNSAHLDRKINVGKKILKKALNVDPVFFSAPNDGYSPSSFSILKRHFLGATYSIFKMSNLFSLQYLVRLPLRIIPKYLDALRKGEILLFDGEFMLVGHKGLFTNPFEDIQAKKDFFDKHKKDKILLIMQHYWEYYYSSSGCLSDKPNQDLLNLFFEIIQSLDDTKFLTLSQLYRKIL